MSAAAAEIHSDHADFVDRAGSLLRRTFLIEQLEAGHSEGLTAYLTTMGRFHNYSFGNILEIARQKPDATRVGGKRFLGLRHG